MHISAALSPRTEKEGRARIREREWERERESEVQNIALWGSNLPDGRKGVARTWKMRNSTRNGRMYRNHGAAVVPPITSKRSVLVYTCEHIHECIYAFLLYLVLGTCIHPREDIRTDTLAESNVSALRHGRVGAEA